MPGITACFTHKCVTLTERQQVYPRGRCRCRQTERRDEAGPVRDLLGGKASPAAF
jgi:hypothetical protein